MNMNIAAKQINPQPELVYGQVQSDNGADFTVLTDYGLHSAEKAVSCLIQPEPGDTALVSLDGGGACFILSILKRQAGLESPQKIHITGPVDFQVSQGELSFSADEGLNLVSENEISCASTRISLRASSGEAVVERFSFLGQTVTFQARLIKTVAHTAEQFISRFTQHLENAWRYVSDHEESQARTSRKLVEESMTVQSKNTYHLAEEVVKIDAGQIHLG